MNGPTPSKIYKDILKKTISIVLTTAMLPNLNQIVHAANQS